MKWLKNKILTYFRKRGWVIFYLDEVHRDCKGQCWLQLYKEEMKRGK